MADDLNCTCFRLRRADRQVTRLYDAALSDSGVTIVQFAILARLHMSGATGISELAAVLGSERTSITRTLERMHALGWLAPVAADDARLRRHRLTGAGREVFTQAARAWRRAETAMARAMGAERLALLWQLLGEAEAAVAADSAR